MNYKKYAMSGKEYLVTILQFYLVEGSVVYLFYNSFLVAIIGSIALYWFIQWKKRYLLKKRRKQLQLELKEMMISMTTALQAGYALENVFATVERDLKSLFPNHSYMAIECREIRNKLSMKQTIESLLLDLADRSGVEEMQQFALVISIAKRNGGNIVKIIRETVEQISDSMEVESEIATMVASKKLEQKIMVIMPFAMIGYLRLCNPGYLDRLYGNVLGIIIMSFCIGVIVVAIVVANKILSISV